jgi:SAM-dependent methyltransferase
MPEARNQCATAFGAFYDFYIERPWLSRRIGRLQWGIDVDPLYASMEVIGRQADGATIVDVPCGGGLALRALRPGQDVRFVAVDIDGRMLERTRAKAAARGLHQVETVAADMRALPLDDASADLLCTYSGLHMIDDPERAVREFARVLRRGGELVGTTFVEAGTRRQRLLFKAGERGGLARPPADGATVARWLAAAGLRDVEVGRGGFMLFRARR